MFTTFRTCILYQKSIKTTVNKKYRPETSIILLLLGATGSLLVLPHTPAILLRKVYRFLLWVHQETQKKNPMPDRGLEIIDEPEKMSHLPSSSSQM